MAGLPSYAMHKAAPSDRQRRFLGRSRAGPGASRWDPGQTPGDGLERVVFGGTFLVAATAMVRVHGSRAEVDEAAGDRGDLDCCGSGALGGTNDLGGGWWDP
jgi:hypothetical protein